MGARGGHREDVPFDVQRLIGSLGQETSSPELVQCRFLCLEVNLQNPDERAGEYLWTPHRKERDVNQGPKKFPTIL